MEPSVFFAAKSSYERGDICLSHLLSCVYGEILKSGDLEMAPLHLIIQIYRESQSSWQFCICNFNFSTPAKMYAKT